jgi:hypothetical protein
MHELSLLSQVVSLLRPKVVNYTGVCRNTSDYLVYGKAGSITISNDGQLYYIGADSKIHRFYWSVSQNDWVHEWIPYSYGSPSLGYPNADFAAGNITFNNQKNLVIYKGRDARLQYFDRANNWNHWWIDDYWNTDEYLAVSAIRTFEESKSSFSISTNGNVYYTAVGGRVREFVYEPCEVLNLPCSATNNLNKAGHVKNTTESLEAEIESDKLVVSPNPAKGVVTLTIQGFSSTEKYSYSIMSSAGVLVRSGSVQNSVTILDVSQLSNGIYFLNVKGLKKSFQQKIIIAR